MAEFPGKFGYFIGNNVSKETKDVERIDSDGVVKLGENIVMFRKKNVGQHKNVFEGEVRSSVYGIRPCVIKFAEISDQNVREAEILTKLGSHTNVIAIIQSGTYCDVFQDRVYIALDKCHNENLRQYLANRKAAGFEFDLNQAIDFAKQILVGVMYIHDNNVIHLDLKPSNILISQNLQLIKIADFGLSIVVKSPKSKVFHKHQFGTNGYRPIESFGNGEVSMRTDIFSLGTVLLHLLSNGSDVFGVDEHFFIHNVMNDVTNTSGLLVSNPVTTEHLIKCMVSKERCRRPNIWEVHDHPCWTGKEVECKIEYCFNGEVADDECVESSGAEKKAVPSQSDADGIRKFVKSMQEIEFCRTEKPRIMPSDNRSKQLDRSDQHVDKSLTEMTSEDLKTVEEKTSKIKIQHSGLDNDERLQLDDGRIHYPLRPETSRYNDTQTNPKVRLLNDIFIDIHTGLITSCFYLFEKYERDVREGMREASSACFSKSPLIVEGNRDDLLRLELTLNLDGRQPKITLSDDCWLPADVTMQEICKNGKMYFNADPGSRVTSLQKGSCISGIYKVFVGSQKKLKAETLVEQEWPPKLEPKDLPIYMTAGKVAKDGKDDKVAVTGDYHS